MMNRKQIFAAALLATLLSGCVPYPKKFERIPAMCGRVTDAITHQPIPGALTEVVNHPKLHATTDTVGEFKFKAAYSHSYILLLVPGGALVPEPESCGGELAVYHANYQTVYLPTAWRDEFRTNPVVRLPDVQMRPLGRGLLPAPRELRTQTRKPKEVDFTWHRVDGASSYAVQRLVSQRETGKRVWETAITTSEPRAVVTGLSTGVKYSFRVAPINVAGTGAWSYANAITTFPD